MEGRPFSNADTTPRVFIVQGQEIGVAEWRFDNNPNVVSWLDGMLVRPVLGVPGILIFSLI